MILWGALGLVLVMLWQAWGEFQRERQVQIQGVASTSSTPTAGASTTTQNATDIPDAPPLPAVAAPATTDSVQPTVPARNLIQITTDLVSARIDPHGGDLVEVKLLQHPQSVDTPEQPFVLMYRDESGLFVAQSGLVGFHREYPNHDVDYSVSQWEYDLGAREQMEVVLHWTAPDGVVYQKVFRFKRDTYRIEVDFLVHNRSSEAWNGFAYAQLKRTEIANTSSLGFLGRLPSYQGAAIYTADEQYEKITYGDMRDAKLRITTESGWIAMMQHYFVAAWLPQDADKYQFFSGVGGNSPSSQYRIGYKTTQPVHISPGQNGVLRTRLFIGPKEQYRLRQQQVEGLLLTVDYGWFTPIADPLFWLLDKIHSVTNNWGWAIILLTLLVKAIFYPLSATSYKSMAKMRKLQPRMATLKERYGSDKQKFQQEMMKLYKSEKVNPAGGCLPILVQIPVFIALYWTLLESVELRQADFMLWIKDLSIPDPYFVLPLIMGASMLAQHFLNPSPVDPLQKKIMLAMPIVFTVFFLWFPAGLVLYWVVNNLLSIAQQYYITRKYQAL